MKIALFILVTFISFRSISQDWFENWPTELTADTVYYRGQRTDLASFDHLLDMLINPSSDKVITSRMYRTFQKTFPKQSTKELVALANKQYDYWKKNNMLWWIADCHADPYMCTLPKIEKLMGVAFSIEHLPSTILKKYKEQTVLDYVSDEQVSKAEILGFFDPIVSTSYRKDIAKSFGRDKNGYDGYVLILNDRSHRNCSLENKAKANCFINNEEFMEELEFPMWGFVLPDELNGFIVDTIEVKRLDKNKVTLTTLGSNSLVLEFGNRTSCETINKLPAQKDKLKRFKNSLNTYFNCSK